jgi:hypothetical protein
MHRATRVVTLVTAAVIAGALSLREPSATNARQGKPIIDRDSIRLAITTPTPDLTLCQDQVAQLVVEARETYEYRFGSDPPGTRRTGTREPAALVQVLASSNGPVVASLSPGSRDLTSPGFSTAYAVTGNELGTATLLIKDSLARDAINVSVKVVECRIIVTTSSNWTLDLNYPVTAYLLMNPVTLRRVSKGRYEADGVLHGLASGDPTLGFDDCDTRYVVHETRVHITAGVIVATTPGGADVQYFDIDLDYDRVKIDIKIS